MGNAATGYTNTRDFVNFSANNRGLLKKLADYLEGWFTSPAGE